MTNQFKELKNLNPILLENEYVFCTFLSSTYGDHEKLNTEMKKINGIKEILKGIN